MTTRISTPLLDGETTTRLRPRYEGSNIGSWIGFKHINYLAEEAVLEHFCAAGFSARSLYEDYGLCVEIVDLDTRINTGFHLDDVVEAIVRPGTRDGSAELVFAVSLSVHRDAVHKRAGRSGVRVLLRRDQLGGSAGAAPDGLFPFTTNRITRTEPSPTPTPTLPERYAASRSAPDGDPVLAELTRDANAFALRSRIPYPYCHFTERMQMSGYLRQMEKVVDLFLADRGVSIKRLLDEQNWIPVVPHSTITMLDEAIMEEDLYTVFTVENIFKGFTYTARMDTYVLRHGNLLRTATGHITHGYAEIKNRHEFTLVELDQRMINALGGGQHAA